MKPPSTSDFRFNTSTTLVPFHACPTSIAKLSLVNTSTTANPRNRRPSVTWENGYGESFNGKLRDECWNGEIFYSLQEAQVVIEKWRGVYNTKRPRSALGYRPPASMAYSPSGVNPSSQPIAVI